MHNSEEKQYNHEIIHKCFKKASVIQMNASKNIEEFIGDLEYSNLSGDEDQLEIHEEYKIASQKVNLS